MRQTQGSESDLRGVSGFHPRSVPDFGRISGSAGQSAAFVGADAGQRGGLRRIHRVYAGAKPGTALSVFPGVGSDSHRHAGRQGGSSSAKGGAGAVRPEQANRAFFGKAGPGSRGRQGKGRGAAPGAFAQIPSGSGAGASGAAPVPLSGHALFGESERNPYFRGVHPAGGGAPDLHRYPQADPGEGLLLQGYRGDLRGFFGICQLPGAGIRRLWHSGLSGSDQGNRPQSIHRIFEERPAGAGAELQL